MKSTAGTGRKEEGDEGNGQQRARDASVFFSGMFSFLFFIYILLMKCFQTDYNYRTMMAEDRERKGGRDMDDDRGLEMQFCLKSPVFFLNIFLYFLMMSIIINCI